MRESINKLMEDEIDPAKYKSQYPDLVDCSKVISFKLYKYIEDENFRELKVDINNKTTLLILLQAFQSFELDNYKIVSIEFGINFITPKEEIFINQFSSTYKWDLKRFNKSLIEFKIYNQMNLYPIINEEHKLPIGYIIGLIYNNKN